jgi:hypothetical protein
MNQATWDAALVRIAELEAELAALKDQRDAWADVHRLAVAELAALKVQRDDALAELGARP